jgi:vitellogenic carboxypeptidase-like protein
MKFVLLFISLISIAAAKLFINPYPSIESHVGNIHNSGDLEDDGVLYITKYLKAGKDVKEIQKMAFIDHPDLKAFPGYSGFITVNETTNSNMFFWYFPAQHNPESAPLTLWLQGGPGLTFLRLILLSRILHLLFIYTRFDYSQAQVHCSVYLLRMDHLK